MSLHTEITMALRTGRDLGPDYDAELAHVLVERLHAERPERGADAVRPAERSRLARTGQTAAWGGVAIAATAWAAESAPEGIPWGLLAVLAVILHVVRTWRS